MSIFLLGTGGGNFPNRPMIGFDRKPMKTHLPPVATDAAFWDGTYSHEHEEIFATFLCTRPKDEDCARITTGYNFAILYEVYTDDLQRRKLASQAGEAHHPIHDDMFKDFAEFFVAYMYIHFYPTYTQMPYMLSTPYTGPINKDYFIKHVKPRIEWLGLDLSQKENSYINPEDAYRATNRIDREGRYLCSIDTAPLYVTTPRSWRMSTLIFNAAKYNSCIFKFQVVVTNELRIVSEYGLSAGTTPDPRMLDDSGVLGMRLPLEWWLGDLAYIGIRRYERIDHALDVAAHPLLLLLQNDCPTQAQRK
jgi:hypothetical protein